MIKRLKLIQRQEQKLFVGNYKTLADGLTAVAALIGLRHGNLTTHSLRRGGASWYFGETRSYDRTQEHGRWGSIKVGRVRINQAMAEDGTSTMPKWGREKATRAASIMHLALRRAHSLW